MFQLQLIVLATCSTRHLIQPTVTWLLILREPCCSATCQSVLCSPQSSLAQVPTSTWSMSRQINQIAPNQTTITLALVPHYFLTLMQLTLMLLLLVRQGIQVHPTTRCESA